MYVDPELGKAAMRLSLLIILLAGGMLFMLPQGTAQYYITVITLGIGVLFLAAVIVLVRVFSR